jgi:PIN domain nuclease of toxin-antitoxin system
MILLDTHILVWLDQGNEKLNNTVRKQLDRALADDSLTVSAISFLELAMLQAKGRIQLPSLKRWRIELLDMGLQEIPLDGACGIEATRLDAFHPDPADRLIVATAIRYDATLVTADHRILTWAGRLNRIAVGE